MLVIAMFLLIIIAYILKSKRNQEEKQQKSYNKIVLNKKILCDNPQQSVAINIKNIESSIIPKLNKNSYAIFLNWINGKKILNND